jgi:thiamine biosynthesis protein ThiS
VIRGAVSSSQHSSAADPADAPRTRHDVGVNVNVNGEVRRIGPPATVASLLAQLGLAQRRIAVAVNREVVPRSAFPTCELRTDDHVEILEAVGGG